MNRDHHRDEIIRAAAAMGPLGFPIAAGHEAVRDSNGAKVRCWWHAERSPSNRIRLGADGTLTAHCFGCGANGDTFDIVAGALGLNYAREDFPRVMAEAARIVGVALDAGNSGNVELKPRAPRPAAPPRTFPPIGEVAALWTAAGSLFDDLPTRRALADRAIDCGHAVDRDLARVVVGGITLPRWARFDGKGWDELDRRVVVPMFDASGRMVSLHARRLAGDDDGIPKGLSPAGYTIAGSVMADPLARLLLSTGKAPAWWSTPTVIIAEGVPDWLTWATHYGDDESAPAAMGVIAGSWCDALAARIPDGCKVIVRTHDDEAGIKYGLAIARSLAGRCDVMAPPSVVAAASESK